MMTGMMKQTTTQTGTPMTINEWTAVISVTATIMLLMIRLVVMQTKIKQTLFPNGGSSLMDKMNDMKIEITKLQTKTDMIWSDVIDLKRKR
jgi:hypothetical protein